MRCLQALGQLYGEYIGQGLCEMQTAAHDAGGRVMSFSFGAAMKVRTDVSRPPKHERPSSDALESTILTAESITRP